jgi:hypothetical protein
MIKYESNIWGCIYRMSKTELPIQFDQLDMEKSNNNIKDLGG